MEKNTILAIALSTIVLVVSLFIQTKYVMPRQQERAREQAAEFEAKKEDVIHKKTMKNAVKVYKVACNSFAGMV